MRLFEIQKGDAMAALRALRTVALADGREEELEQGILAAAAQMYGVPGVEQGALAPITPEELAAKIVDPGERERVIQGCLVMGLADGEAEKAESATIQAFARALGVPEKRLSVFESLASGARLRARVDFTLHSMLPSVKETMAGFAKTKLFELLVLGSIAGREDSELAWRYRRLGLLPEHTLGRQYWAHMREQRFAFPGEIGGAPELAVQHDMAHVLTGYGTDPAGELQIGVFTGAMKRNDGFTFVFFPLVQFHAGVRFHPIVEPSQNHLDPRLFARALERGSAMRRDITSGWDHWADVERPIADVREELGVLPP